MDDNDLPQHVVLWFPVLCALSDEALQEIAQMSDDLWMPFCWSQMSTIESLAVVQSARALVDLRRTGQADQLATLAAAHRGKRRHARRKKTPRY